MNSAPEIDVGFDFTRETPDRDPDFASPTLRGYHRLLWSKELRSGDRVDLDASRPKRDCYLHDRSSGVCFSSDSITHSYSYWRRPKALVESIVALDDEQHARLVTGEYTIASAMIFPVRFEDKPTINQARGTRSRIADRFDLTLECIRRHYAGEDSPLADVLTAYGDWFTRFDGFEEFVEFFLLQDLVDETLGVRFLLPLEDFDRHGAPRSVDEYVAFRESTLQFVAARTRRIAEWAVTAAADTAPGGSVSVRAASTAAERHGH